jgi:hypothetical protein
LGVESDSEEEETGDDLSFSWNSTGLAPEAGFVKCLDIIKGNFELVDAYKPNMSISKCISKIV